MNRGSDRPGQAKPLKHCGFNEAPIHESGKSSRRSEPSPGPPSFNEAPIHESGKWPRSLPGRTPRRRFNEAPIHESGKSVA